jgi:hypothetical protein
MRGYLTTFAAAALLTMACCIIANLILDPYRILHPAVGTFSFQPSDRVAKAAFLSGNCRDYSGYFMGDSRAEILNDSDLRNDRDHFYNLSSPRDGIDGILRRIDFLVRQKCPLATVIVGESIDVLDDESDANLVLTDSPLVTGRSRVWLFARFLFNTQTLVTYARVSWPHATPRYVYYPDGHVDYLLAARSSSELTKPNCAAGQPTVMSRQSMQHKLSAYRTLSELAARHHFKAVVWITPLNHWYGALFDEPVAREYLSQLRAIPNLSLVEASRQSPLLSDYTAWYDCIHFRHSVFDQLVAPSLVTLLSGG